MHRVPKLLFSHYFFPNLHIHIYICLYLYLYLFISIFIILIQHLAAPVHRVPKLLFTHYFFPKSNPLSIMWYRHVIISYLSWHVIISSLYHCIGVSSYHQTIISSSHHVIIPSSHHFIISSLVIMVINGLILWGALINFIPLTWFLCEFHLEVVSQSYIVGEKFSFSLTETMQSNFLWQFNIKV